MWEIMNNKLMMDLLKCPYDYDAFYSDQKYDEVNKGK